MEKEGILDVLFWLGFFVALLFIFINSIFFLVGVFLVLIDIFVNFSAKNFLKRDIYVLGYFIGAMLSTASINKENLTAFIVGLVMMLFSIILYKYYKIKFEKKAQHHEHHIIHHKVYRIKEHKKEKIKLRKIPHIITVIWAFIATIVLVASVILSNKYILYLGLIMAVLTIILNIIDSKQLPKLYDKEIKTKEQQKKVPLPQEQKIIQMKRHIALKYGRYETDIDKLYRILEKFKSVKISEIKKVFNISAEKAEEWAKILEQHDLGELHYPAFGEPELKWKQ